MWQQPERVRAWAFWRAYDSAAMPRSKRRISVVIVDDHRAFGEALQVALGKERDLEVLAVLADGESAVMTAERQTPDVALVDLQMPGLDGLETARRIQRSSPETAVVILTGVDDDLAIGRAAQAGAHGFLKKTEAVAVLADAVRRAHRREPLNPAEEVDVALRRLEQRRERAGDTASRLERLTPRELEILQRFADGSSSARIAADLRVSRHTLRTHTQNILTKLGAHSKVEAIVAAIRHGKVMTSDVTETGGQDSAPEDATPSTDA